MAIIQSMKKSYKAKRLVYADLIDRSRRLGVYAVWNFAHLEGVSCHHHYPCLLQ